MRVHGTDLGRRRLTDGIATAAALGVVGARAQLQMDPISDWIRV